MLTIHRSKGLEFPIVYFPYLWEPTWLGHERKEPVFFHDPDNGDARTIDVGARRAGLRRSTSQQHVVEARGEDLRLAYVALTRARHQAVVWWAGSCNARDSALSRLLFARGEDGTVAPKGPPTPSDLAAVTRLNELAAAAPPGGSASSARCSSRCGRGPAWRRRRATLDAAAFARELDWRWRRTSFSDITAGAYEARVASEPEEVLLADEPDVAAPLPAAAPDGEDALRELPAVLAEMGVGVRVGTLVHRVLEATDFAAADLSAELAGARRRGAGAAAGRDRRPGARRRRAWRAAIETPLGPLVGDLRLRDIARADRLDELAFELPLVGGDDPTGRLALDAIAAVLARAPAAGRSARRLRRAARGPEPAPQRARLPHRQPRPRAAARPASRFAVVDYKTNWLAAPGEALTAWHHRPAALAAEMEHAHYGLQALLYTVALHRYLRWRLPGYDPDVQPRRRALPVPARDDRAGRAARGRRAVRRVRVAAAGRAGGRAQRRARPGRRGVSELAPPEVDAFDARRALRSPAALRPFNEAGVLAAADVHVARAAGRARRRGRPAGRARRRAGRARAAARARLRRPRHGARHDAWSTSRSRSTSPRSRGRPSAEWTARLAASAAASPSGPLRLEGTRAVPRPLLARGAPDRRRPARVRGGRGAAVDEARARRRARAAVRRRRRRPAAARGRGRGAAAARGRRGRPGHRQDDDRRADRRAAGRAGRRRARRAAGRAGRADRQGGGAAGGGGPRRGARGSTSRRDVRASAARARAPRRCTGCSAAAAAATAASATTAATGSRTTWSSSTRPRWSRCR